MTSVQKFLTFLCNHILLFIFTFSFQSVILLWMFVIVVCLSSAYHCGKAEPPWYTGGNLKFRMLVFCTFIDYNMSGECLCLNTSKGGARSFYLHNNITQSFSILSAMHVQYSICTDTEICKRMKLKNLY